LAFDVIVTLVALHELPELADVGAWLCVTVHQEMRLHHSLRETDAQRLTATYVAGQTQAPAYQKHGPELPERAVGVLLAAGAGRDDPIDRLMTTIPTR
jgi:hypothetical protein